MSFRLDIQRLYSFAVRQFQYFGDNELLPIYTYVYTVYTLQCLSNACGVLLSRLGLPRVPRFACGFHMEPYAKRIHAVIRQTAKNSNVILRIDFSRRTDILLAFVFFSSRREISELRRPIAAKLYRVIKVGLYRVAHK